MLSLESDGTQREQSTAVQVTCTATMTDCDSTARLSLMHTPALLSLVCNSIHSYCSSIINSCAIFVISLQICSC